MTSLYPNPYSHSNSNCRQRKMDLTKKTLFVSLLLAAAIVLTEGKFSKEMTIPMTYDQFTIPFCMSF